MHPVTCMGMSGWNVIANFTNSGIFTTVIHVFQLLYVFAKGSNFRFFLVTGIKTNVK